MTVLKEIIRGVRSFYERKDPSKPHINVHENRIEVADVSFTWDEISVVEVYKIDLGTTDEVRVQVGFGNPEKAVVLSEEQEGFDAFIRAAEARFSFPDGWWARLVRPAFKSCNTTLFRRGSQ